MKADTLCPVCGNPLSCFCPKCRGSVRSERKTEAARENATAPRPNARGPRKPKTKLMEPNVVPHLSPVICATPGCGGWRMDHSMFCSGCGN